MCNSGADIETTIHYLLRCRLYSVQRMALLNCVYKLDFTLHSSLEDQLLTDFLYGSGKFALNVTKEIIRLAISFLHASERFVEPLLTNNICIYFFYLFILFTYLFFIL